MRDARGMSIRNRMEACPVHRAPPEGFVLSEVEVRLARPEERPLWDALMDEHHCPGFRRLAGRGLRYVATFGDRWLGLAAWQNGAFKCRPRDRWTGWKPEQQFRRLEMVANNTRFLILSEPGVFPNLASRVLAGMTRRLAGDWLEAHGHRALLAGMSCDPELFPGTMHRAAGRTGPGETRGFARSDGRCTGPRGKPKEIFATPLRPDAREPLSNPMPLPPDVAPPAGPEPAPRNPGAMRSMHAGLAAVPDFRRAQGRKRTAACVPAMHVLAELANMKGCLAAAQFARSPSRAELEAVGAWTNPKTGLREPVSKSTIHRVVQSVDPEALEDVVARWSRPRLPLARALAADGKRIRGASRNGEGRHGTVALVDHASGAPFALPDFGDEGGGPAATHDLLERSDIRGKVITLDALHTTRKTAKLSPDEVPAMLEAEHLHHRPAAVDEHVPAPAGRVLPEMGRDQRAQPVEAAAHVRRFRRQPDAARRPAAEHQDRRRRSVTPSPSDSSTSQSGPVADAISTKPPGLPVAARPARPRLRRQPWNDFTDTPRASQKAT